MRRPRESISTKTHFPGRPFAARRTRTPPGQALARLHLAAQGFDAPRRKPRPLVASFTIFAARDPGAEMERYLAARACACRPCGGSRLHAMQALDLLAPFHAELAPLLPALRAALDAQRSARVESFLERCGRRCAGATAIIDFGLADRTNAVHDIAHAIERNIVEWLALVEDPAHPDDVPVHFDHLEALLDGYESVRPLTREEAAALAPMTALCHAEFALSEADYFLGVLHSEEKAAHGLRRLARGPCALVSQRSRPQAARCAAPLGRRRRALPAEGVQLS